MRKKQEDRCDERKWEIEMRKKNEEMCGVREILRLEKKNKKIKIKGQTWMRERKLMKKKQLKFSKFSHYSSTHLYYNNIVQCETKDYLLQ